MNQPPPVTPPKKSGGCLKGCLITLGVLIVISAIAAYFVIKNVGGLVRQGSSAIIDSMTDDILKDAKMDPAQKAKVDKVIKGFTVRIRNGEVGLQQGVKVMETLVKGPFIPYFIAGTFEALYLNTSGLSPAEKEAGKLAVNRFMQGVIQETISKTEAEAIFDQFSNEATDGKEGKRKMKEHLTDEEVRSIIKKMETAANGANVGAASQVLDIADELQRAIENGLSAQ